MTGTQDKRREPAAILIVQEEEVFSGFLQHFPAGRYALLYAAGAAEAMALCETRPPKLIILPGGPTMAGLTEALREVSRHKAALLAVVKGKVPTGDPPPGIDRVATADDLETIIEATTELLKERREKPRVLVEIPIRLDENGEGVARDLSANFMQIHTTQKLKSGQKLMVEIGWGEAPMQFATKVFKADTSVLGATVAMLEVEKKPETRAYLDNLVKKILEVEHYLQGTSKRAPLRGPVAWKLARRTEDALRDAQRGSQVDLRSVRKPGEPGEPNEAGKAGEPGKADKPAPSALESRYHLLDKLGDWGIGVVHNATHQLLNRPVSVKVLRAELRGNKAARARMEQEARVASALICDQVVDVLDFGKDGEGGLYYAMESLEGKTLAEAVAGGEFLTAVEAVTIGVDAAQALKRAHSQKHGHHDLCPSAIFLAETPDGRRNTKLINFAGDMPLEATEAPVVQGAAYRPPESSSVPPSPAYDIYALGATLWDVLGAGGSKVVSQTTKPGELSPGERRLREILHQARAPDRKDRFLSMTAFEEALLECLGLLKDQRSGSRSRIESTTLKPVGEPRFTEFDDIPIGEITIPWPAAKLREIADRAAEKKAAERKSAEEKADDGDDTARKAAEEKAAAKKATPDKSTVGLQKRPVAKIDLEPPSQPAAPMNLKPRRRPHSQELDAPPDTGTLLGVPSPRPPGPLKPAAPAVSSQPTEQLPPALPTPPDLSPIPEPPQQPDPEVAPESAFDPSQPLVEAVEDLPHPENAPATLQASPTPEPADEGMDIRKLILIGSIVGGVIAVIVLAYAIWPSPPTPKRTDSHASAMQPAPRERPRRHGEPAMAGSSDGGAGSAQRRADAGAAVDPMGDASAPGRSADAATAAQDADVDDTSLTPKEKRNRLMAKAQRLLDKKRYPESRRYLTRALKIDDSARLRRYFSRSYEKVGKFWPAIYHMKKAVKFSPRSAQQHAKLGMLYLRVGQHGNACRSFRFAVQYKPGHRAAKRQLDKHCQSR